MTVLIVILGLLAVYLFPMAIYQINKHLENKAEQKAANERFKYKADPERFNYSECVKKSDLQAAKKSAVPFRKLLIAGAVIAFLVNSCDFGSDEHNNSSVITETKGYETLTEFDVNEYAEETSAAVTATEIPKPNIVQGDGYSFIKPDGWRLQQSREGGDFEVHYSIPYIDKGVIAVYINRFPMDERLYEDEESFDDFAESLYEFYSYNYSMEKNTTVSKSLERTSKISGEVTYNFFVNTLSDIVTYDSSKVRYGKDEYGNTIITNMEELELVEYHDVPCRSNYYWVQNGNDLLEVNIMYTIEGIAKAEKYSEDFLNGIMLEKNEKENEAE